ncbi:hypothetical protein Rhom172_1800 [Rhodothermus marinus SG0.5JP17-172]|uniref:hypothetical protein n=1 Tax=Rhodothermus marinus TaxID=29549 RepID=UPI000223DCE8|nr:hypothetical protein [Rhodothermus marinus]AEN73714.1 hypothetical protein Rhom172_1800 [Rhodothermus marinus SG0.5JP17-172]
MVAKATSDPEKCARHRRALELAIAWARDWHSGLNPYSLENALLRLVEEDVPRDQYLELWEELRQTLRSNPHLQTPEMRALLTDEELAARGYWWFDPVNL